MMRTKQQAISVTAVTHVHKFEEAGLGIAPFQFIDVVTRKYQACHGAPVQPGGRCAYCGEGIMECCVIQDAKGKRFEVGNVCVGKTGDEGLINLVKWEMGRLKTEARHTRESARIAAARVALTQDPVRNAMASVPSPNAYYASKGATRLDWAEWMLANAGSRGKMEVAHYIDGLLKSQTAVEDSVDA